MPALHHAYLCDVLERVIKGDIKRLIITMPPGSAKSTYTSKLLPPFALQNHPRWNIIGVSNVTKLAMSFSAAAQQHIRDNGHVLDYGLATEAVEEWSTTMGGTYKAAGIGATIVGKRADLAIIDDPVSGRDEVENIEQRDKVWDWYWGTLRQRLKPSGRIIVMATRWHADDLIGRLIALQPKLWTVVNIKAEAETDDPLNRAPGEWLWSDPDDPFGYGIELAGKKAEMETVGSMREWYSQFQGGPRPTEGALFKTGRIQVLDVAPELRGATICRGWDFAATKQTGTRDPDWTVGVKLARLPSGLYVVLDVFRDRGGPNDVAGWLNNLGRQDGTGVKISCPQDPGQAGKSQAAFFTQMLSGLNFEHSLETGDKATRASPVISQCNGGNLAIVKAPWNAPFLDELTGFPSGAKDDQVDALSRAFSIVGLAARPLVFSADVIAALGRRR